MNERIKELRKKLGLTLEKFGERLGVKKAAVSKWENGDNITDQMFKSICREFNVNEEWLRNGTGEMTAPFYLLFPIVSKCQKQHCPVFCHPASYFASLSCSPT